MDKYIKRLQTRACRKGISVSKTQVREVYELVVASPENPSEEEMSAVIQQLEAQYQAPSFEPTNDLATTEESAPIQQQEELQEMTLVQTAQQPTNSSLATSSHTAISQPSSASLGITQQQIQQAVEEQFGKENVETKNAILNYVAQDTFSTAQELQTALSKLRQMRLDILMKLIADHTSQSSSDEDLLKKALLTATANRQGESEAFFVSFESQLSQMKAAFGV